MVKRETVIVLLIGIVFIWFGDNPTIQIPLILLWLALAWSDHEKKKRRKKTETKTVSDEIPLETRCDLIERELKMALEDVAEMRANGADKEIVKRRFYLLRAALLNAKHYLTELENSLNERQ